MKYVQVKWLRAGPGNPIQYFHELTDDRRETRTALVLKQATASAIL